VTNDIIQIDKSSPIYPDLLKNSPKPPTTLYLRGNHKALTITPLFAVVGSRRASHYGKHCVEKLLTDVVLAKVPLVSGLAYGIDSLVHKLCLKHNTPTIAVLGSGLDDQSIYPKQNIKLANHIINSGGLLISEYEPGTRAYLGNFPQRNRIVAGLTVATLVIQAAKKSGTLITARLALEAGRDVYAVPGALTDPLAAGTNGLIQQGAAAITSSEDLLCLLGQETPKEISQTEHQLTTAQAVLLKHLSNEPKHVDEIVSITGQPSPILSITLTELELLDLVTHIGGMQYVRK
jgi:DNA processing protein